MSATPRRKKDPYIPGKDEVPAHIRAQYGIPNPHRRQHSHFHADQLAPGAPHGGIIRSRVRSLFTTPQQKQALVEFVLQDYKAKGVTDITRDEINVDQTSIDRNFSAGEYNAICWYVETHAKVEDKGAGIVDYDHAPKGEPHNRLPFGEEEERARAEYAHVNAQLPKEYRAFLRWVVRCQSVEESSEPAGRVPGKVAMAKMMFWTDEDKRSNDNYLRGGVDGYFKAVCASVAHARMDWVQQRKLKQQAKKLIRINEGA